MNYLINILSLLLWSIVNGQSICSKFERSCERLSLFTPALFDYNIEKVPEITNQHTDLTDIIYKAYEKASVLYNKSNSDFVESSLSKGRTFAETHEIIFPALVSLFATETLLEKYGAYGISTKNTQLGNICSVHQIKCGNEDYRNADGHCNNILHPTWGATSSRFQRLITSKYVDNFNTQISSLTPNFATQIFEQRYQDYVKVTNIVTHWSNFVYHDIVKIQSSKAYLGNDIFSNLCCDPNNQHPECVPVNIPVEPSLNFNPTKCIPYIRTLVARRNELCEFGPREQGNQATSFLDASTVYGNTQSEQSSIRAFSGGKVILQTMSLSTTYDEQDKLDKVFPPMLNLFQKHHNNLATSLQKINDHWTDDIIFQETRKIVIAQIQFITMNEYLPILIGQETASYYKLKTSKYNDEHLATEAFYDLNLEPSTLNSFAAAVGNFFLTIIPQYHNEHQSQTHINSLLHQSADSGSLLTDLLATTISRPGLHLNPRYLKSSFYNLFSQTSLDYPNLLVQLSKDHGLASYTEYREKCGGTVLHSFEDLYDSIIEPNRLIPLLKKNYKHVREVELAILGLAEKPVRGALVGPTFGCIIGHQFRITKNSDRFWYDNTLNPNGFSFDQLTQIKKTTLTSVMCNAMPRIVSSQPKAFEIPDNYINFPISCNVTNIQAPFDLTSWKSNLPTITKNPAVLISSSTTVRTNNGLPPLNKHKLQIAVQLGYNKLKEVEKQDSLHFNNQFAGKKYENYPLNSYAAIMKPRPESLALSRTAKLKMETIKIILNGEINVFEDPESSFESLSSSSIAAVISDIDIDTTLASNENETEICFPKNLPCDETYPYRLQHGWCNNLKNPQFATSFSPLVHLVPHEYENGIDVPRQISKSGKQLPMPRRISNMLNDDEPVFQKKYSHLVMQFGQFLDHEITHVATETGPNKTNVDCSPCDSQSTINRNCMPIDIPINDPHFPFYLESGERRCLPFIRSLLTHADNGVRNQVSQLTPYIDGSTIYGSSPCDADEVRLFKGGLLRWADLGPANREALPLRVNEGEGCRSHPDFSCFKAGEFRNTHQPGLTVIHNVFQREHNRIVRTLAEINPTWNDEKLFQEGRKILGAVYQHITYSEYVPLLVGNDNVAKYNLNVLNNGYFKGYDNECEASVSHPFATAAFRYGHTLVRSRFKRLNAYYQNHSEDFELKDNFDNAEPVHNYKTGGIDTILVGLLGAASMEFDRFVTNHLRNHLFARKGQKFSGFDLIAINIQRARDHGVAPYNKYREYCGFPKLKSFQDLSNDMDQETIDRIKSVYESVEDIDLFTGLITERSLKGALLSPTASCIISEQFDRLKKCDRFYYENDLPNTKFTEEQLREIRKASLATIFCDNSDILQKIQPNVFELPDDLTNAQIPCDDLARIDLKKWSEAPVCIMETTVLNLGEYRKKSPCLGCVCTKDGLRCETIKVTNCKKFYEENKTSDLMNDPACIIQCPMIKN